eukprot:m.116256 g.116256  ORF g.116256 m.116256 type:complete len:890 (+) comp14227_c0_seq8:177-2846(+)
MTDRRGPKLDKGASKRFVKAALANNNDKGGQKKDGHKERHNQKQTRTSGTNKNANSEASPKFSRFEEYVSKEQVVDGLKTQIMTKGRIRVNDKNFQQAFIAGGKVSPRDILINGIQDRNRALDGDSVVVQLYPKAEWQILEKDANLLGCRHKHWKLAKFDSHNLDPPANKELTVRAFGFPQDTNKRDVALFVLNNISEEQVFLHDMKGSLKYADIVCNEETQARGVVCQKGAKFKGSIDIHMHRGDGAYLDIDTLDPMLVQPLGKVVQVDVKDPNRIFAGSLRSQSKDKALFVSRDFRVPRMLIESRNCPKGFFQNPNAFAKKIYAVSIEGWPLHSFFPKGKVVRELGIIGDIKSETNAMLLEHNIDTSEFPPEVLSTLPQPNEEGHWDIPQEELQKRRDLRNWQIFSIDPPTARDLDDALSIQSLEDGNFEIGVHIADVSHFMKRNTKLDDIASRRATTTYLVGECFPMLPRVLCENLCSLTENVDRLAFSVVWKMNQKGEILHEWFGRTVIRSCCRLAYGHAKQVLENKDLDWSENSFPVIYGGHTSSSVKEAIEGLNKIALKLREKRYKGGSLRLDQVKVGFDIDPMTGLPRDCYPYKMSDANRLVEEFMLLANMAVATKLYKDLPNLALLRRHPMPAEIQLQQIAVTCKKVGIELDTSSSGSLHRSLQVVANSGNSVALFALQVMLAMPMKNAEYLCSDGIDEFDELRHYALSVPLYTHFTSPIRRMADVVVHRLLAASLEGSAMPYTPEEVELQALECNDRKEAAKKAQERSANIYMCAYIKEKGELVESATVLKVQDRSFDVLVDRLGVNSRILLEKLESIESFSFSPYSGLEIRWNNGGGDESDLAKPQNIKMFSQVKVRIKVAMNSNMRMDIVSELLPNDP